MSHDGRACSASVPDAQARQRDGACAAGTFPPRVTGLRKPVVLDAEQRRALLDLVTAGTMLRRSDCYFSLATGAAVSTQAGRFLKRYNFAVAGFNNEIVPTDRGRMIANELSADHVTAG